MNLTHNFVDLDTFIAAAFAPIKPHEKVALGLAYPGNRGFKPVRWEPGRPVRPLGLHFGCASFRSEASRATIDNATRCFVIMLDDVGDMGGKSKCPLDRVLALPAATQPHSVIVTRRVDDCINTQCCWFIVPVSHYAARSFVAAAVKAGWGDPGASGGVRWARPPGSVKQGGDGYAATVLDARLDAPRIGIGALAEALGVPDFLTSADNRTRVSARSSAHDSIGDTPPAAADVRTVMRQIVNDLDRADWVRIGMALKACCGGPPSISDDEGRALFDAFSYQHPTYNSRKTLQAWRGFRSGRIGFGTLIHFARRAVLEIGSGRMDGDPASPRTPTCVIAPDAPLARGALKAFKTTHALVIPGFSGTLMRYAVLPKAASSAIVIHRGTPEHQAGVAILLRRLMFLSIPAAVRILPTRFSTACEG